MAPSCWNECGQLICEFGQGFLLHEMQLLPQVASATVTLITLFTCGSNVVQYTMLRRLPLDYGM